MELDEVHWETRLPMNQEQYRRGFVESLFSPSFYLSSHYRAMDVEV